MECKEFKHLIQDLCDDLLSYEKKEKAENHIKECPECRKDYEKLQAVLTTLTKSRPSQPAPYFWQMYLKQVNEKIDKIESPLIEKQKAWEWIFNWIRRPAVAFSLTVVILISGFVLVQLGEPPQVVQEDEIYINSLEFFIAEYNSVSEGNIFMENIPFDTESYGNIRQVRYTQ